MDKQQQKRIDELEQILNNQEPYSPWHCFNHQSCGSGGTNRHCCEEELMKLLNIKSCPTCKGKGVVKK